MMRWWKDNSDRGSGLEYSGPKLFSAISDNQTAYQDAGSSPYFAVQREGTGAVGSEGSVVASPFDHSGLISSLTYASESENGQVGPEMVVSPLPVFAGLTDGYSPPGAYRAAMEGMLGPIHPFVDLELTIDSSDETINLAFLHGAGENGMTPGIDMMKMFDPDGNQLAQINPDELGPAGGPPPDLNVTLRSAPVGGKLFVQVAPSDSSAAPAGTLTSTDAAAPAGDWSVPFVLYVQRQDDEAQTASSGLPAQGVIAAGTLALTSSGQVAAPTSFDGPAVAIATQAADPGASTEAPPAPATSIADESAVDSASDGFNLRLSTGPLASRTAGPLGPILAGIGVDPTPEVDRNERGLFRKSSTARLIRVSRGTIAASSWRKLPSRPPSPTRPAAASRPSRAPAAYRSR